MGEECSGRARAWIPVRTGDGSFTLAHPVHGETCHSRAGAWEESRLRYALACRLAERARTEPTLRLLDVGTGLGLNLAAAIEAVRATRCRLEIVTLELDPGVIEAAFALEARERAAYWSAALTLLREALQDPASRAQGEQVSLQLVLGDARESIANLPRRHFDAIFLDAFSPRVEPELWTPGFLRELAGRMAPGGLLSTYSASTAVRVGLAAAGLRVGPGARVGTKSSGTLASPDRLLDPFPARLGRRISRRAAALGRFPFPAGISPVDMH